MAWSSATLAAAQLALKALNKPVMVAYNATRPEIVTTMQWRTTGSLGSGSDGTAAAGPGRCAGDGFTGRKTFAASSETAWYFNMNWATAVSFDCFALIGHNFGSIGSLTACELEIADNEAFDSNLETIATFTPGTSNDRLVSLVLDHDGGVARQYSGVQHARLKLTKGAGFTPQFGELILGRQIQLSFKPDDDYDPYSQVSGVEEGETLAGVISGITGYRQRRMLEADLTLHDAAEAAKIATWWVDSRGGTCPFLWIDEPAANPAGAALMVLTEREARMPYESADVRSFHIEAAEQGPDFVALEA